MDRKIKLQGTSESAVGQRSREKIAADQLNRVGPSGGYRKSPPFKKASAESQAVVLENSEIPIIQSQIM